MSDYPHAPPYGASYGTQHQPNASYVPPTYPNHPYPQTDSGHTGASQYTQNYEASLNPYGYNQQAVPAFTATSVPSGPAPPKFPAWNQDPATLPAYTTPQNTMPYPSYADSSYNNAPYYPSVEQQSYLQNSRYSNLADEGELSGGEYDDTYAPTNPALVSYGSNQYQVPGGTGYMGTAQRAVYPRTQNYSPLHSAQTNNDYYPQDPSQAVRQHSDSYSPYNPALSAADQNDRSGTTHNYNSYAPGNVSEQHLNRTSLDQNPSSWNQNGSVETSQPSFHPNRNYVKNAQKRSVQHLPVPTTVPVAQPAPVTNTATLPAPARSASSQVVNAMPLKSVAEARKEAQGAILNLYPFQVGFQNFMDEGFDEAIVGRVFDDLGLARPSSKASNVGRSSPNVSARRQPTLAANSVQTPSGQENIAPASSKGMVDAKSKTIEILQGTPKALSETHSTVKPLPSSSSNVVASVPPGKPLVMTEKERKLQMKMEALRKSREQRAQKAAAKSDGTILTPGVAAALSESSKSLAQMEPSDSKLEPKPEGVKSSTTARVPSPNSLLAEAESQVPDRPSPSQSTSLSSNTRQVPAIPGLFLAPNNTSPAPTGIPYSTMYTPVNGSQRKRPVATDFDALTTTPTSKRPFGQSRYEAPLVINVTDEEPDSDDEDVAMELESSVDHNSPVQSARNLSDHRNTTIQSLPVLTNFPARKPFTPPPISSAVSTPTTRKTTLGNPEVLQEKEIAIEALRKKIAEAEAAKALKKARRTANGTGTPRTNDSSGDDTKVTDGDMASKIEASIRIQERISTAEVRVSADEKRLAVAQAAEIEKVAELKRNETDQKRLRREQIATDLPRVDAEVERNRLKLELLRAEVAKIEAAVQKHLEEKKKMADEMDKLGQEAEDRLQAEKEKLKALTNAKSASISDSPRPTTLPANEGDISQSILTISTEKQRPASTSSGLDPSAAILPVHQIDSALLELSGTSDSELNPTQVEPAHAELPAAIPEKTGGSTDDEHVLEIAQQDAVRVKADSISQGTSDDKNMEDSPALDTSLSVPESVSSPMEVDSRSPSYSPVLGRNITTASERDDDYEPPEATPPVLVSYPTGSPPFSPAPPNPFSGDIANSTAALGQAANEDGTEEILVKSKPGVLLNEQRAQLTSRTRVFTPYESPLKRFRAFRFHPEFGREVSGGLRSLTYSHKIDPMIEMCPWEMAGGTCNDETCEYQHVRDIRLPDDDILKALGSQDGFTGEQRIRFIDGLKDALGAIRERKIRDFDSIAKEILAYRRRFLDDASKVLALEGTTI